MNYPQHTPTILTRWLAFAGLACLSFASLEAQIPVSGSTYSENFDSALSGGTSTVPSGWTLVGNGITDTTLGVSDTDWAGSAGGYNAALQTDLTQQGDSSTDRGLSVYATNNTEDRYIQATFTNSTGGTISELSIDFNVAFYGARNDDEAVTPRWDGLVLQADTGSGLATTTAEATFTNAEIDFASGGGDPWNATANGWATSGMIPGGNKKAASVTLTGLSIADGATFTLRWLSRTPSVSPSTPAGFSDTTQLNMSIGIDDLVIGVTSDGGGGSGPDAAPSGLSATTVNSNQIDLAWTDNSSNETGFRIERATASGGPWTDVITTGIGATSYSDTGLSAGTPYFYQVIAVNEIGDSAASNEATATTATAAPGTVQFTSSTYSVSEDGGSVSISVERVDDVDGEVTIGYTTGDDTATIADNDYDTASGTLTWANGESGIKSFNVTINDDSNVESDEDFTVTLSGPTGGVSVGTPSSATVTITNDDNAGTVEFTAAYFPVDEGTPTVTLTVSRTGGAAGAISVDFVTFQFSPSTGFPPPALEGSDYAVASGTLNWADGDTDDKEIVVTIIDDSVEEYYELDDPNFNVNPENQYLEEFGVLLSNPQGGTSVGTLSGGIVSITDDDQNIAPVITIDSPVGGSAKYADGSDGLLLETTVTDDGLGSDPYNLTLTWTQVSGSGTATFADASAADTAVSFDVDGEYVLRLTANDGRAETTADVTVNPGFVATGGGSGTLAEWPLQANLNPSNVAPAMDTVSDLELVSLVNRGYDGIGFEFDGSGSSFGNDYLKVRLSAATGALIDLNGGSVSMAVDYVNGTSSLAGWRCDVISDPDGVATTLTLDESADREDDIDSGTISGFEPANTVEIRIYFKNASWGDWNVANLSVSGSVGSGNVGPDVNAGADASLAAGTYSLVGSATDDGEPASPGAISYEWTQLSGDTVTFSNATSPTSDATFPADGSYVLQLAASDGEVTTTDSVAYSIGGSSLTPAESWRDTYFSQTENTGDAADGNDFDTGGSPNLLERAFGTNPTNGSDDYSPVVGTTEDAGSDYPTITYRRLIGGSGTTGVNYTIDDLTYTVEYDTDLVAPWSNGSVVAVGSPVDNGDGTETVTVRLTTAISGATAQFIRVKVTSTP